MSYLPQFQQSPYMQQRQRPQGLLGQQNQGGAQIDQGLLSAGAQLLPSSRQIQPEQPEAERPPGAPPRLFDPLRQAMNTAAQPVRDVLQPMQQGMNQVQQGMQDFITPPQQPTFTGMQGGQTGEGGGQRQQMLMQMLMKMFGG